MNQFNHALAHYTDGKNHYWYDGTNRKGLPGMTTTDMINQNALVIKKDSSYIVQIKENPDNLCIISANLKLNSNKEFAGKMNINLINQFSIHFNYIDLFLNDAQKKNMYSKFIHKYLSEEIVISNLTINKDSNFFQLNFDCVIPNGIIKNKNITYTSLSRIFPNYFTSISDSNMLYQAFYNPMDINRAKFCIKFDNLYKTINLNEKADIIHSFIIPAGPFNNDTDIKEFANSYQNCYKTFTNNYTFYEEK